MKNYKSDQYSLKVVDEYYRNWIKEKCYNYNQSTEIPEECNYLRGHDNEKAPNRFIEGLKCYKNVWPGERFIGLSMGRIPRTPDIKTCSFLHTVPMYREKAFEEITEVDRSDSCFFREYKSGMSFEAAEELERREVQNKKKSEDEKSASSQSIQSKGERIKTEDRQQEERIEPDNNKKLRGIKKHYIQKKEMDKILKKLIIECKGESNTRIARKAMSEIEKTHGTKSNGDPIYEEKTLAKEVSKLKNTKKRKKTTR
jgi:hypothetical protein